MQPDQLLVESSHTLLDSDADGLRGSARRIDSLQNLRDAQVPHVVLEPQSRQFLPVTKVHVPILT